jgi:hypothetical protein
LLAEPVGPLRSHFDPGVRTEHAAQLRDVRRSSKDRQAAGDQSADRRKEAANIAADAEGSDQPGVKN